MIRFAVNVAGSIVRVVLLETNTQHHEATGHRYAICIDDGMYTVKIWGGVTVTETMNKMFEAGAVEVKPE